MSDKKQSSIEWLVDQLDNFLELYPSEWEKIIEIAEKAKAMHMREIVDSYVYGAAYHIDIKNGLSPIFYYKEKFEK
jgi:hypothetical protein